MRVVPTLSWSLGGTAHKPVDPRLFELLEQIAAQGSLRAAAGAIGMPYRSAWGLLQAVEADLGSPLVRLQRGRGATLSEQGATLLRGIQGAGRKLRAELDAMALEIGPAALSARDGAAPMLRLAASHDPALAGLQDALPAAAGARLSIEFCGSLAALARFSAGEVDMAGFHFVRGKRDTARPFLSLLSPSRDRLLRFVDREQGLIVERGNPAGVRCLADIVRRKLRFVNRQAGSGTRLLLDAQLAQEGLDAAQLRGYGNVEFTHAAVAATIASGHADAAFGVAAAAAEYDLGFVPMVRERYYFALRAAMLHSAPIAALRESLAGPVFRDLVGRMAGYDATHSGQVEPVRG